jgi:myosin protein heavy chain
MSINIYITTFSSTTSSQTTNTSTTTTSTTTIGARLGGPDDIDHVRMNEGRGRFYVEAKSVGGGSMLQLKSRKPLYRVWLEKQGINEFLKKAQKTTRFRDLVIEKFAAVYGLLMVEEDEKTQLLEASQLKDSQIEHHNKKIAYVQDALAAEEDAKRRMLLRYIHAVKEHALSVNGGSGGVLQLPESNITDEEIHALAALLRNNTSIDELNLRGNVITDDGARALGAVLAGKSGLRLVDLRGNKIGKGAIRVLAEALERSERVRHVYVHAGGKIEALGASRWAVPRNNTDGSTKNNNLSSSSSGNNNNNNNNIDMINENKSNGTVETVCVVDIRDNHPEQTSFPYELEKIEIGVLPDNSTNNPHSRQAQQLQQQLNLKQSSDTPTRSESKKMKSQLSKSLIRSGQ